jgi:hypothetical protein
MQSAKHHILFRRRAWVPTKGRTLLVYNGSSGELGVVKGGLVPDKLEFVQSSWAWDWRPAGKNLHSVS